MVTIALGPRCASKRYPVIEPLMIGIASGPLLVVHSFRYAKTWESHSKGYPRATWESHSRGYPRATLLELVGVYAYGVLRQLDAMSLEWGRLSHSI